MGAAGVTASLGPPLLWGFPSPELLGDEVFLRDCIPLSPQAGVGPLGETPPLPIPGENGSSPSWGAGR